MKKVFISLIIIIGMIYLYIHRIFIVSLVGKVIDSINNMLVVAEQQVGGMLLVIIKISVCSIIGIILCVLMARLIDFKKYKSIDTKVSLSEKHPNINMVIGIFLVIIIIAIIWGILYSLFVYLGMIITKFVDWSASIASKLDAVVIVALITGAVSLIGVIISSVVAKIIDYKENRKGSLYREYFRYKWHFP